MKYSFAEALSESRRHADNFHCGEAFFYVCEQTGEVFTNLVGTPAAILAELMALSPWIRSIDRPKGARLITRIKARRKSGAKPVQIKTVERRNRIPSSSWLMFDDC